MKTFRIVSAIFFLMVYWCERAEAQLTNLTLTISDKSFPERSDWGESVRISKVEFFINDRKVGTLVSELASSENSTLIYNGFYLNSATVKPSIIVTYIHHTWNAFGDKSVTGTQEYNPLETSLQVNGNGDTEPKVFSSFDGLPMIVNWSFTYQVSITPFSLQITPPANFTVCFKDGVSLNLQSNQPDFYTTAVEYEWQYGFYSTQWIENLNFKYLMSDVANSIYSTCPEGADLSCYEVYYALSYSDFSFMNEYYYLYENPEPDDKYEITHYLISGILDQHSYLSSNEQEYLSSSLFDELTSRDNWTAPFIPTQAVTDWHTLGYTNDPGRTIKIDPSILITTPVSEITKMVLQVRAVSPPKYSPFSNPVELRIRPKEPEFEVAADPSCESLESGVIKLSNIRGALPDYKVVVLKNDGTGVGRDESFSGTEYNFAQKVPPGIYEVDLVYSDPDRGGCATTRNITVTKENDLIYSFSKTDPSCPESADAKIKVNVTSRAHYSSITLNERTIDGTSGEFAGLDDGKYIFTVRDFCTVKNSEEIVLQHLNDVTVYINSSLDPECLSVANGSVGISAAGSLSGKYDYEFYDGPDLVNSVSEQASSYVFGQLPGGNYRILAKSHECGTFYASDQKSLVPVQPIDFTSSVKDVKCFGESTGEIGIVPSGGKPVYHYQLENNAYTDLSVFSGLASGTYQVRVHTKDLSCNDVQSKYITVNTAPKIRIGLDVVDAACFESEDGSLTANVSGGSGVYSYSWQENIGGSWYQKSGNSNKLPGLFAGRYKVNITDSWGCPMAAEGSVTEPPLLVVGSAVPKDVICFGENGSIRITASGGSGAYEYSCTENGGTIYKSFTSDISLPAGNYYAMVKDGHGCESSFDDYRILTVTAPLSALDFSQASPEQNGFNLRCNSDNSGAISLVASGGNGPGYSGYVYSVSGKPDNISGSFDGLAAGLYTLSVKDARGCIVTKSQNLTQPDPVSLNLVSITPVKCFGASTGEIRVAAAGGIAGTYKYKLDGTGMVSPGIFQNLQAKTYDIEAADANGCRQNIFATVQSLNPPIGIVMIPEGVRCFGEINGRISTIVSGGSGGFSYAWEVNRGTGWQSYVSASGNLSDLVPAKYRIKATDSENCNESKETEIKEPSKLIVSGAIPRDVVCFGGKGSLSISASGGNQDYTYFFREKSGIVYDSPQAELQLPAGVFNVSVTDGKGCEASYPGDISITAPSSSLDFTTVISSYNGYSVTCSGKNDGFILAEPAGGNGSGYSGYKYSLNGSPDATENRFSNLAKGSYLVRVTDARGCKIEKSLFLNEPQPITANILSSTPVTCFGENTGEISAGASGGIQNTYKYSLNDDGELTAGIFKNLTAGSYTVNVTDINGCSKSIQAIVINKNPMITTRLSSAPVRCNGENNGTITSIVSGGAGGFSYLWEKRSQSGWVNIQGGSPSAGSLSAGYYRLSLRDADNCPAKDSIAVIEPLPLEIFRSGIKDAVCFGEKGSIDIEAQGGNGEYSYYLSENGGLTYSQYNPGNMLLPASYRIKVRDLKGCELIGPEVLSITAPNKPLDFSYNLSEYGSFNISCHGNNDGSVSLIPAGGNDYWYNGYQFLLNGTEAIAGSFMKNLEAGNYDVSLIDGRGCMISKTLSLSEPPSIMKFKVASLDQPKCVYDKNGSVSLFAEGGNMPYEYSVNGSLFGSSPVFSNLGTANYSFKVRDANGCSEAIDTSLVNLISEMKIRGVVSDARCYNENSGSVEVQVSDGASPYSFRWKDNPVVSSSRSSLRKGEYTVSITDAAGCISETSFFVNEPEYPLSISAVSFPACAELKNGSVKARAEGGTPPYLFALDKRSGYGSDFQFDVFSGNHNVYVSDMNNCLSETSVTVSVLNVKPDINFMLATNRYELDTLVIIDVSVPVPDKVKWEFPEGTMIIDTSSHKAMIRYLQPGIYPVKMTGIFGTCIYSIDKHLNISPFDPLIPGEDHDHAGIKRLVISPNPNDGRFIVHLELYSKQKIALKVFDFYSRVMLSETWPADIIFRKEINMPENIMPGNYVLWIIGENDSRPLIFVISK